MTTLSFPQVAQVAQGAGFRGAGLIIAIAVTTPESGRRTDALNPQGLSNSGNPEPAKADHSNQATGLWQILPHSHGATYTELLDPNVNARYAYRVSSGGTNWRPWQAFNSGAHLQYMDEATAAAGGGGAPGPLHTPDSPIITPDVLEASRTFGDYGRLPNFHGFELLGSPLTGFLRERLVAGATISMTADQVAELTLPFVLDPLEVYGAGIGAEYLIQGSQELVGVKQVVKLGPLRFRIVDRMVTPHARGVRLELKCQSEGARRLMERFREPATRRANVSPTQYLQDEAHLAGCYFVGKGTAIRDSIGPQRGGPVTYQGEQARQHGESVWDLGGRLAEEEGFWFFEAGMVVFYGPPTFLTFVAPEVRVGWRGSLGDDDLDTPEHPAVDVGSAQLPVIGKELAERISGTFMLPKSRGRRVRPGMRLAWCPIYIPSYHRTLLVTDVGWGDDPVGRVTVKAETPIDPVGEAEEETTEEDPLADYGNVTGRQALDFVSLCLRQVGDRYIFGAEADLADPDPEAFDCSELVQWACARVGVTIPDGSKNQAAHCQARGTDVPVDFAIRTRGALLFRLTGNPTHVAVSLGDGQHTVEARGSAYGVVQGPVEGRTWTLGARIPDMAYT